MGVVGGGQFQGADGLISVKDLPEKIEEYFQKCKPKYLLDGNGKELLDGDKPVFTMNAPSINGLCRFLGYSSVSYMNNVMRHPDSPRAQILQKAITRIAEWHESRLADKNAQGSIFWLKQAQKEIFGDSPQTHVIASAGLTLSDKELENFKNNISAILGTDNIVNVLMQDESDEVEREESEAEQGDASDEE